MSAVSEPPDPAIRRAVDDLHIKAEALSRISRNPVKDQARPIRPRSAEAIHVWVGLCN